MKVWGVLLLGVGGGAVAGVLGGRPVMVPAIVALGLGAVLLGVGARRRGSDLVGDATATRTPTAGDAGPAPLARHLGSRVEHVLRLAEEQAADHIAEAEATAARIVADARAEADRLKST
jgi:hypothetical protein